MNPLKFALRALRWLALWGLAATTSWAATPCVTATPDCTEWITLAGGPSRALLYRSHTLQSENRCAINQPALR